MTDQSPKPPATVWTDERIRETFIYDGGEAEYHDPISGAQTQRQVAGSIFDAWLAAHDAALLATAPTPPVEDEKYAGSGECYCTYSTDYCATKGCGANERLTTPPADDVREALAGVALIAAERSRQVSEEGYTPEHDQDHAAELSWAARCYAENVAQGLSGGPTYVPGAQWGTDDAAPDFEEFPWPWHRNYWKPTGDTVRDLAKAGALIAAAIDSLAASAVCTCPSGDGSLRWPCPVHPPAEVRPRGTVTDADAEMLRELRRRRDAREIRWTGEFFLSREELDLLLRLAEVRPRGMVSEAAVDAAGRLLGMDDGTEHWIDRDSVRDALEAAWNAQP